MLFLTSRMDFTSDFGEERWDSLKTIGEACRLSRSGVIKILAGLVGKGYLKVRKSPGHSDYYSLTNLVFEEYVPYLQEQERKREGGTLSRPPQNLGGALSEPVPVHSVDGGGSLSEPELPHKVPKKKSPSISAPVGVNPELTKARKLGKLIYMGGERYVDRDAVSAAMERAYERYGLDVLLRFTAKVEEHGTLGKLRFDPNMLNHHCQLIQEELQKGT